jgi:flagellar basal-body rod protein FlgB
MQPIQLFELASSQAHWLSVRQSVVAGNIANANTPGYVAMDTEPFGSVLESMGTRMSSTHPMHFAEDSASGSVRPGDPSPDVGVSPSGNTVSLEQELMNAGEVRRSFELNTGLVRSFHRMMLMTVRK